MSPSNVFKINKYTISQLQVYDFFPLSNCVINNITFIYVFEDALQTTWFKHFNFKHVWDPLISSFNFFTEP